MKITVLTGSPNKNGASSLLADKFIEGAAKAGHEIVRFDTAFKKIHPCTACGHCQMNGPCVFQDDGNEIVANILDADLIVLATPLYSYTVSAQLKAALDRLHAKNHVIFNSKKNFILLATSALDNDWVMKGLEETYANLVRHFGGQDLGKVLAKGCLTRELVEQKLFAQKAYELGLTL